MTPKEKAEELVSKYYFLADSLFEQKQCALIAVDEILKELEDIDDGQTVIPYTYWEEVKKCIQNMKGGEK